MLNKTRQLFIAIENYQDKSKGHVEYVLVSDVQEILCEYQERVIEAKKLVAKYMNNETILDKDLLMRYLRQLNKSITYDLECLRKN